MTDRALRELERAWRAEPSDDALAALLEGYRRIEQDPPLDVLRASPRWRRLTGFVRKWYAQPLGDEDGNMSHEIVTAEKRLGFRLPRAVREWYAVVGRRLERLAHDARLASCRTCRSLAPITRSRCTAEPGSSSRIARRTIHHVSASALVRHCRRCCC